MNATCKLGSKGCFTDGKCRYKRDCENKVITNADRIRAMTDEELAVVIMCPIELDGRNDPCDKGLAYSCLECCLQWLQEPAKEE